MRTGEERKLVTVLFADLVGSTAFVGDRDPERVRERFYDAMRAEMARDGWRDTVDRLAAELASAAI